MVISHTYVAVYQRVIIGNFIPLKSAIWGYTVYNMFRNTYSLLRCLISWNYKSDFASYTAASGPS